MGRHRERNRILGPYPFRSGWRYVEIINGHREYLPCSGCQTAAEAEKHVDAVRAALDAPNIDTVEEAVMEYVRATKKRTGRDETAEFVAAAMLLANPSPASLEVINDQNYYIANFWRCIKYQPDAVYIEQDYPVSHVDLDARHMWLTNPERVAQLRLDLADAEWPGDARIAGWWVWGQCCWIGSGWCEKEFISSAGMGVQSQAPHISDAGRGVRDWFRHLAQRLERVRVCHGDWTRCLNSHYGDANGGTAFFFDPPYLKFEDLYQSGADLPVARQVEAWCRENETGHRIAICGLVGDYDLPGWSTLVWNRGKLTYGGSGNGDRECIWFSPECIDPAQEQQQDMFEVCR